MIFARRLVAQRCLYGVDRNPVAVDLAKMSLWLVTLAREHPLTFLDHALRHGDSLVGLSRRQIEAFHWNARRSRLRGDPDRRSTSTRVAELRREIREAGDDVPDWALRDLWDEAQPELRQVRLFGDLVVAAFFAGAKPTSARPKRLEFADAVDERRRPSSTGRWLEELRDGRAAARAVPLGDRVPGGVRRATSRDSMRSSAIRRSRARTRIAERNSARLPRLAASSCTRRATATPTSSRTSSGAPSTCCAETARSA